MNRFISLLLVSTGLTVLAGGQAVARQESSLVTPSVCAEQTGFVWGETVSWTDETGPEAREHAIFLADPDRNRLLLVAGSGYNPQVSPVSDAWAFDLTDHSWRQLTLESDEILGGSRRATRLDENGVALVFGGYDATQQPVEELLRMEVSQDTIRMTRLDEINAPPPRFLHAFVRDELTGQYLAFGGVELHPETGFGLSSSIWSIQMVDDVAHWQKTDRDTAPSGRYGFPYFIEPETGSLVVWGGADLNFPGESPVDI